MQDRSEHSRSGLDQNLKPILAADRGFICVPDLKTLEKLTSQVERVTMVDLGGCETKRDLILRLSERLKFPGYSSANWDSFEECLAELEWFIEGTLVIAFTNQVDSSLDESDLSTLFAIIRDVSREWADQGSRQLAATFVGDVSQSFIDAIQQSDCLLICR